MWTGITVMLHPPAVDFVAVNKRKNWEVKEMLLMLKRNLKDEGMYLEDTHNS